MMFLGLPVRKHFLCGVISSEVRLLDRRWAFTIRIAPRYRARRKAAGALFRGVGMKYPLFVPPSISPWSCSLIVAFKPDYCIGLPAETQPS
jgi:hypothetical protein